MKTLALTLALLVPALSGCYGPFNLTRKVHAWNGQAGRGRWTNEFVFLGLAVLNVYTVSALADAVVFNTWEFWSGHNPVPAPVATRAFSRGEAVATLTLDQLKPSIRLSQRWSDGPERVLELRPIQEGVAGLDGRGRIVVYARFVAGRIVVTDNEAHFIRVYEPDEIARLGRPASLALAR
jgi:hypothetical protein